MEKYRNVEGNSGVTRYEIGESSIAVEFSHEKTYLYTYKSAGKKNIEQMKRLALQGKGLSTYISQKVKDKYERTL